jgi:hypothetical protein
MLPKNLITAPCRNVAVVVSEIPLPPSPVHAAVEGRRSAAASGQNSERVGDEVYVYSVSQPPRRLLVFIGSSQRFIFLSSIRLITAQLIQAETATFIKQAETAYLIAVKLPPLSSDYRPVQECCGSGFGDPASSKLGARRGRRSTKRSS